MHAFLSGFSLMLGLIVAIGAQNAFVLRQGLLKQHIGIVILICWLCDCILSSVGVFGLASLTAGSPTAVRWLSGAGGLFLLWYALQSARRTWQGGGHLEIAAGNASGSAGKIALTTLALTLLNPHVYIDTMLLVGGAAAAFPAQEKWSFLFGACTLSGLWFFSLGYGTRLLLPLFKQEKVWRILDSGITVMMSYLSIQLFRQAW